MEKDKPTDYIPTQKEIEEFIMYKNGFTKKEEKLGVGRNIDKNARGALIYRQGNYEEVVHNNKPFALLNALKKQLVKQGYQSKNLIITYAK